METRRSSYRSGKLAKIAAMGYLDEKKNACNIDNELELVDIQNHVYEEVKVIGKTSPSTPEGAVQIGLENYTGHRLAS